MCCGDTRIINERLSEICESVVQVFLCHVKTKGPHHIHSFRSSCFIKKSAFNVAGTLVMVEKFTFQSVFSNSRRNLRRFSARGREESLEPYSILWSDWPTSKRKVSRHGIVLPLRFADAKGEKRRLQMRLLFAGYRFSRFLKFFRKIILLSYPVKTEIVVNRKNFSDESSLLGNIMCYVFSPHQHYIETPYKMNQTFKWISKNKKMTW